MLAIKSNNVKYAILYKVFVALVDVCTVIKLVDLKK